ncbi:hypothetical protein GCM10027343_19820 [Noviherbaspirillum agri]
MTDMKNRFGLLSLIVLCVSFVWTDAANALSLTKEPSICANAEGAGSKDWSDPANAQSSGQYNATANGEFLSYAETSYLRCAGYNFAIPGGASIDGITVTVTRAASEGWFADARDFRMRLVKGGVVQTTDLSKGTAYPTTMTAEDYGGPSNLWGGSWTAADINDPGFGAALSTRIFGVTTTAYVDSIQITVDYTFNPVVNTYYPPASVNTTIPAGATSIELAASTGSSTPIERGDVLLILQMQDATIDAANNTRYGSGATAGNGSGMTSAGNSGLYEYVVAANSVGLGGGTLRLGCGTVNAYTNATATSSRGQRRFQVIRVPAWTGALVPLTARAWDGSTGGVLALDAAGALNLNGVTLDVSGKGFRGGGGRTLGGGSGANNDFRTLASNNANGSKGEGIAGTPRYVNNNGTLGNTGAEGYPNGSYAMGAPANAGGGGTDDNPADNDRNTGGGGGGNAGAGGIGGYGWSASSTPGRGRGGAKVPGLGATRLILGGGGGAGTTNNGTGTPGNGFASSGAAGGGIIMVRAGSLTGSGIFDASGAAGNDSVGNDGSGGGGAGGSVLVYAASGLSGLKVIASGGKGGNNTGGGSPHGPGGGGGGGYVLASGSLNSCAVTGGANGTTFRRNNDYTNSYGAEVGDSGICATNLKVSEIVGVRLGSDDCLSNVNHYAISHSEAGITCEAEPVTITAHDVSHKPVNAGGRSITLAARNIANNTMSGTWVSSADSCDRTCYDASGAAKACANSFIQTTGNNGTASYTFAEGEAGIRLCLKQSSAITQNIDISDGNTTEAASEDKNLVFGNAGLRFYSNGAVDQIGTLLAGLASNVTDALQPSPQSITIRAVKSSETTPARCISLLGNKSSTIKFAYQCTDPNTCQSGSNGLEVNGTKVSGSGSVPDPASDVSVQFDKDGYGSLSLKYWDVGQIKLYAKAAIADPTTTGTVNIVTGSSNAFLVRPYDFSVIPCTALVTPNSCDPGTVPADPGLTGGGGVFVKAGQTFNAIITARTKGGAVTPSFGLGTGRDTEKVNLTHSRQAPEPGSDGALAGATSILRKDFTNGVATVKDLAWDEVGVITLKAMNLNFLGKQIDPLIPLEGTSGNIGRFIPNHFDTAITGGMTCPSALTCPVNFNGFVYSGQPFTTQIIARNATGGITTNYKGPYARETGLKAWDGKGSILKENPPAGAAGTLRTSATLPAPPASVGADVFVAGEAKTSNTAYTLPNAYPGTPPGPTNIYLRATDADGVTSLRNPASASVEGGILIVSGRFVVANAHGSELLRLPIGGTAQYYNGSRWVISDTDTSTIVAPTNVLFDNYKAPLEAVSVIGAPVATTLVGGRCPQAGCFVLAAPGAGRNGSADIRLISPAWLPSTTGRATFGVRKGPVIYIREIY